MKTIQNKRYPRGMALIRSIPAESPARKCSRRAHQSIGKLDEWGRPIPQAAFIIAETVTRANAATMATSPRTMAIIAILSFFTTFSIGDTFT